MRQREESQMNRNRVIDIADAEPRSVAVTAFYDRYRERITGIKTVEQRNGILSDMQEDFTRHVRNNPHSRNELSEAYQLLKKECWEVDVW